MDAAAMSLELHGWGNHAVMLQPDFVTLVRAVR
jgi:hypothetical protein